MEAWFAVRKMCARCPSRRLIKLKHAVCINESDKSNIWLMIASRTLGTALPQMSVKALKHCQPHQLCRPPNQVETRLLMKDYLFSRAPQTAHFLHTVPEGSQSWCQRP
uniref:Uncharacterized protein n=1 Tax=Eutreptiella gymnastica TaxID=73025 RepID=A0A7S4CWY8_9EUGL